jgi:hypothetical protein
VTLAPRSPIHLDRVLDDPTLVHTLVREHAPYWPVYRYFADATELRATGAPVDEPARPMRVPPWFRGDWAREHPLVRGIEPILHNSAFDRAARELYGLSDEAVIRQQLVYVNLTLPMPLADYGHTDVPAFRGLGRRELPIWLLSVMGHSGLFEPWRIRIATIVSWWFEGQGGEFTCWPDGPDAPPTVVLPRSNTAIAGENEIMFHRVERVGHPAAHKGRFDALTVAAELVWDDDAWLVVDADRALARVPEREARISVSWKAEVFADEAEAELVDRHSDDLDLDRVWAMLVADLRRRGVEVEVADDPLGDSTFIAALSDVYPRSPTVFPRL